MYVVSWNYREISLIWLALGSLNLSERVSGGQASLADTTEYR